MVTREAMETAVKSKIDNLLHKLEKERAREDELKEKTIENFRRAKEEDEIVTELEDKLKSLEDTLLKTETENAALKLKLQETEAHLEAESEFNSAQEADVKEIEDDYDTKTKELNEISEENKKLSNAANNICDGILKLSIDVRQEEAQCQLEEERVAYLSKELNEVSTKLSTADSRKEVILQNADEMMERIQSAQKKRDGSEASADELDLEIKRLEQLLEDYNLKLNIMKTEQEQREIKIAEGKRRIALELQHVEGQAKTSNCHQAQCVVKKRR